MTPKPEPFFTSYTKLVVETDLVAALREQGRSVNEFVRSISPAEAGRLHGTYTWTPREVVQHIIDAERVFGYRALRFARGDATPLPGFDENAYALASDANGREIAHLADEIRVLRESHVLMFAGLSEAAWQRKGIASNIEWSVTDLARAIVGHCRHHETILRKRLQNANGI